MRYLFGGETLFQNRYKAGKGGGWISFEEELPGQTASYTLKPGTSLVMGKGTFVAADSNVKIATVYGGISGWLQGLGFAKQKATLASGNEGRVFFGTVKGVVKQLNIDSKDGSIITDNDNTVAYRGELSVKVRKPGGVFSMLFSGEGVVNEFRGKGGVFLGSGEGEVSHNVFEQTINALRNACIPSKEVVIGLVALYIILNSDVAVAAVNAFKKY